jgi:RimJ/RimL family protein N-acetyltransferase
MAISLRPMTEKIFNDYYNTSLKDYAQEHVKAGNWHEDEAEQKAEEQFKRLLPNGLASENHFLFSICDDKKWGDNGIVGVLWLHFMTKNKDKRAFIYDFEINEQERGKGLGKKTMNVIDEFCKREGAKHISLHVFAHNERAIALYKKMGYDTTDYYMSKQIQ